MDLAERFPHLHRPDRWEWARTTMRFSSELPDDRVVVSTHVVGFVGDSVLLCQDLRPDVWFLPGGTREPGESPLDSLTRELMEEAGARLVGAFHPFGAHVGTSEADGPYRPHLPFPHQAWLWGWAEVEIGGPPTAPEDGEPIAAVECFPVAEAVRRAEQDTAWLGELITLAAELRSRSTGVA